MLEVRKPPKRDPDAVVRALKAVRLAVMNESGLSPSVVVSDESFEAFCARKRAISFPPCFLSPLPRLIWTSVVIRGATGYHIRWMRT